MADPDPNQSNYDEAISHLVRKGNIVIFPAIQNWLTKSYKFTPNAMWSVKDALAYLPRTGGIQPDLTRGVQTAGYSIGGAVAVNMAARWVAEGLPGTVTSVVSQVPAVRTLGSDFDLIDTSLAGIPATGVLECIVMDEDTNEVAGRLGCDRIWARTSHIPGSRRNYIWVYSDNHGSPAITADHDAGSVDADRSIAWYATWKLMDAARDCSRTGTNCNYALGNTSEQTFMGVWSDGVPVRPLKAMTTIPPP